MSWQYWKSRLNGDARALGSVVEVADRRIPAPFQVTVVGVAPPGFAGLAVGYAPDVWMSLSVVPEAMRSRASLSLVARLKPGVTIEQARAEMRVLERPTIEALARRDPQWLQAVIQVTPARTGLDTLCVSRRLGGFPIQVLSIEVGARRPLGVSSAGVAILAAMPTREARTILARNATRFSSYSKSSASRGLSASMSSPCSRSRIVSRCSSSAWTAAAGRGMGICP